MIRRSLFALALLFGASLSAHAQTVIYYKQASGFNPIPVSVANPLPITGSISTSIAGFQPSTSGARGTPVSVTTSDSSGTLPTGAVVLVSNVGSYIMYCNVNGVAATASDQPITSSGGWFAFTIPSGVTALHCIAVGGSTTANMVGGSGIPTGTGGGGGGSGGAVTIASGGVVSGAYSSGAFASGSIASGALASGSIAAGAQVDLLTMRGSASGGTAAADSILAGGVYNSSPPTLTNGQQASFQFTSAGSAHMTVDNTASQVTPGSGISAPTGTAPSTSSPVTSFNEMYNGTTWDAMQDDANKNLKVAPLCTGNAIPINQTSSTDVHTFTGYGYICSIVLVSGTQQSISISEGTGSTCGTGTAYIIGGSGGTMVLSQYGGFSAIAGIPWLKLKNSADHLCVLQSSTGNVSGTITFADLTN